MPLRIEDHGRDNHVMILPALVEELNGRIELRGDGNSLTIGAPAHAHDLTIGLGARSRVVIGPQCVLGNLQIHTESGGEVSIGTGCAFNGTVRLLLHEARRIALGDFCLIANDVDITVSDMHSIIDAATGARLNPARDVSIGDHVWVGQRSQIMKGARIGARCVIGAGSIVTRTIPANCIAAGNPARVLRKGVSWRAELI